MDKTQEVYEFIEQYIYKNNYPPTIREIGEQLRLDSTSSVVYHLKKLEKQGKISRDASKNRAIELIDKPIINSITLPVLGTIAAGNPILAEESWMDKVVISENFFIGNNLFMLKVQGDSMVDVGIFDGDYVVISKQKIANNGEIVACLLENEATVKRIYKENGYFRLQPENDGMRPIFCEQLEILGKVVGLIRNRI